jgi:hypothetical protein
VNSFAIGFFISVVGGFLASLLVNWLDRRFRLPSTSLGEAPVEFFPRPLLLRIGSISVVCAWACLLAFLLLVILASTGVYRSAWPAVGAIGSFFGLAVLYTFIAFTLRCPKCRRHVFVQWTTRPPHSEKFLGLEGWGALALKAAARGEFRCMYCGQRFVVTPNHAVQRTRFARR